MKTSASIFTGGGLWDIGARQAGYDIIWGIEYDDKIAQVARDNGLPVISANVKDCNPADFITPNHIHASPPCPNFSQAKNGAKETLNDIRLSWAVCRFLKFHNPDTFTLENVTAYSHSLSFGLILRTLNHLGYFYHFSNVNSADFGVPQTRRRLILRASKGLLPNYPRRKKWVGWYESIEDLIDTLPDSAFASWQSDVLERNIDGDFIVESAKGGKRDTITRSKSSHGTTLTSQGGGRIVRAYITRPAKYNPKEERGAGVYGGSGNAPTVMTKNTVQRAFIVDGKPESFGGDLRIVDQAQPTPTVTSSIARHPFRAGMDGRVVAMTPRALARFQSMPDDYILPDNNSLACKIIGNGVPCLLAKTIMENI